MPIPPINASLAASSAINSALQNEAYTIVNFGAGYISAPNTYTPNQTATPTATSALGDASAGVAVGPSSLGGLTITKTEGEIIAGVIFLILVVGVGAYLHEKKIIL